MIFDYTAQEWEQLIAIDARYAAQLDALDAEMAALAPQSPALAKLRERRVALEDGRMEEFTALKEKFEKARFDALGGSTAAILADAKRLAPMIIEKACADKEKYDLVFDAAKMLFDAAAGPQGPMKPRQEAPRMESAEALARLRSELRLHFAALKSHPEESAELRDYVYSYISTSPYIYTDPNRPVDMGALGVDAPGRPPLPAVKTYGLMNDKVNHQLIAKPGTSREVNGQMQIFWGVEQAPGGPSIPVYVSLRYDGPGLQVSKPMTAFDTAIYNSVSTLWYCHRRKYPNKPLLITLHDLWRTTNGATSKKMRPSDMQLQRVRDSLDKMRFTRIYIDLSHEIQANRVSLDDKRLVKGTIDTYLLKADLVSFTTEKGRTVEGYRIESEPILYTYNRAKNHLLWVDFPLLDTSDATGNDGNTIEFRQYLLQQIQLMKGGARASSTILYETLYKKTAIAPPETRIDKSRYSSDTSYNSKVRQEAKTDREKIDAILGVWAKKGFIQSFSPLMKGKKHIGVKIDIGDI